MSNHGTQRTGPVFAVDEMTGTAWNSRCITGLKPASSRSHPRFGAAVGTCGATQSFAGRVGAQIGESLIYRREVVPDAIKVIAIASPSKCAKKRFTVFGQPIVDIADHHAMTVSAKPIPWLQR